MIYSINEEEIDESFYYCSMKRSSNSEQRLKIKLEKKTDKNNPRS